jgi:hypothetical protein
MDTIGSLQRDSEAWQFFIKAAFAVSVLATSLRIFFLPTDLWVKGYMAIPSARRPLPPVPAPSRGPHNNKRSALRTIASPISRR